MNNTPHLRVGETLLLKNIHSCGRISRIRRQREKLRGGDQVENLRLVSFSCTTTLPVDATEVVRESWPRLSPLALLMSEFTLRVPDPAIAMLTTLLTLGSTGASEPPA